jgi:peptidoglycan/xylan/chitin deacetylase (PgdA/CDA1 family)
MAQRIAVLMYHDVCDGAPAERYTVSRERLAHDAAAIRGPGAVDCELTFDDGRLGTFVHGLPVLVEAGLEATLFVTTSRVGRPGFVTADMLRAWCAAGQRVGSHAVMHHALSGLRRDDAVAELRDSKRYLEDLLGATVDAFAFPGGNLTRRLIEDALAAGYRRVHTSRPGFASPDDPVVPRFTIRAATAPEAVPALRSGRGTSFFLGDRFRSSVKGALGSRWYGLLARTLAGRRC